MALVEVRALHALLRLAVPSVPAGVSVWQPEQRWAKISAPSWVGVVAGDLDALGSATRGGRDRGYSDQ